MPRDRTDTLAYRAAVYFGVERLPRTSIKVGPKSCLIVMQREPGRRVLAFYGEEFREPRGEYLSLTDSQRQALWEALDAE